MITARGIAERGIAMAGIAQRGIAGLAGVLALPLVESILALYKGNSGVKLDDSISPLKISPEADIGGVNCLEFTAGGGFAQLPFAIQTLCPNEYVTVVRARASDATGTEYIYSGVSTSGGTGDERFYIRTETGGIRWAIGDSNSVHLFSGVDEWKEYAVVWDGAGNGALHIDGNATPADTMTGILVDYSLNTLIEIGRDAGAGLNPFAGNVAEFSIYRTDAYSKISDENLVCRLTNEEGADLSYNVAMNPDTLNLQEGIWNQWVQPHAVEFSGFLYYGFVANDGSQWISRQDLTTRAIESKKILDIFSGDDHNAPAVYVDATVGIAIFATGHNEAPDGICYWDTFANWAAVGTLTQTFDHTTGSTPNMTYNQVWKLGTRYYWISRSDFTWRILFSTDNMVSWSTTDTIASSSRKLYHLFKNVSGDINAMAVYANGSEPNNIIRFGKLDANFTPHRLYYNSGLFEDVDGTITNNIDWSNFDDVVGAAAGEFFRLMDVTEKDGTYYITYLITGPDLSSVPARVMVASGDWGDWTITDTGISGGNNIGYGTYHGLATFDNESANLGLWVSAYDSDNDTTDISRYELSGGSWVFDSLVKSGVGKLIRPSVALNSSASTLLWCDTPIYTHFTTFTGYIASQLGKFGVKSGQDAPHTGITITWTTSDGIPSTNAKDGFNIASQGVAPYIPSLVDGSAAANGMALTNLGDQVSNGFEGTHMQVDPDFTIMDGVSFWGNNVDTWDAKTSADYEGHVNGTDNLWLKRECINGIFLVKQAVQYPVSLSFTEAQHNQLVRWAGDPTCGAGTIPFRNYTNESGDNYIKEGGDNYIGE